MEQDWDNLLLLDACRYDYFRSQEVIDGELTSVISRGAHSWEFMEGNFTDRELHDTVYVTANPHVEKLSDDVFFTVEPLLDQWDKRIGTIHPEDVVKAAKHAHENYPNKRLIIHFMQPHHPFIGPTANNIRESHDVRGINIWLSHDEMEDPTEGRSIYALARDGHVPLEDVRQSYSETLEIALENARKLVSALDGKSVISSDHGEMLGERGVLKRRYGHPHDLYNAMLRKVPWLAIDAGDRRDVFAEEPLGFDRLGDDIVNRRLKALGYAPE